MRAIRLLIRTLVAVAPALALAAEPNAYRARQQQLFDRAGVDAYVVHAVDPDDLDEPYRENPDFFYLTGLKSPAAVLVVEASTHRGQVARRSTLFLKRLDARAEMWQGSTSGYTGNPERDAAQAVAAGVDRIEPLDGLSSDAERWLRRAARLALPISSVGLDDPLPTNLAWLARVRERYPALVVSDLSPHLAELRAGKNELEIAAIEKAVAATIDAHQHAARAIAPNRGENEIDGIILARYRARGAQAAFPSIVGSGPRSTTLHYSANDQPLPAGALVVIDIGAAVDGYAADITRTYPVSGKFSPRQREIYEIVLRARAAAIAAAGPGKSLYADVDAAARKVIADAGFADAFWHNTSHYLGIEVHDAGPYGQPLVPGMVFTIEPGIYLPAEGIGVRIEDDLVVTADGVRVLSSALPVEVAAIERLMAEGR